MTSISSSPTTRHCSTTAGVASSIGMRAASARRRSTIRNSHTSGDARLRLAHFGFVDVDQRNLNDDVPGAVAAFHERGRRRYLGQDAFARLLTALVQAHGVADISRK